MLDGTFNVQPELTGKGCCTIAGVAREGAAFDHKAIIPSFQLVESPASCIHRVAMLQMQAATGGSKAGTAEGAGTSEAQSRFQSRLL